MAFLRDTSLLCIPNSSFPDEHKFVIGGICMVTSSAGLLGAALQLKSLLKYRNRQRRWPSPDFRIIFYLALSDMVACVGIFFLAIFFMAVKLRSAQTLVSVPYSPDLYEGIILAVEVSTSFLCIFWLASVVCASLTIFSYLASYIWTFSYALDMCFQIYRKDCRIIVYHILAWIIPLELVASIQGINNGVYPHGCELVDGQMSRLILSYILVPFVIFANTLVFWLTYGKIKKLSRSSGIYTTVDRIALTKFRRKFFGMVAVFAICWLPNIFTVFYDLYNMSKVYKKHEQYLELKPGRLRFYFVYIESILNPLQGLFNYFIYRNSFMVTATETRTSVQNSLPRVCFPWLPRFRLARSRGLTGELASQPVPGCAEISNNCDAKTPILSSSPASKTYTYTCRLLGE